MNGFSLHAVGDLVAATRAVGHHNGAGLLAQRRQQAEFGHLHRDRVVPGFVAEAAGHATARGFDQLRPGLGNEPQHIHHRRDGVEGLLVAMAVQQDGRARGPEIQGGETRAHITRQQLLEQQRLPADDFGSFAQAHHQRLVAQRQQARGFQPDDGAAGPGEG